jgi:hypothetical protein
MRKKDPIGKDDFMKRWIFVIVASLLLSTFAGAEPFFTTKGPIMEVIETEGIIVVNETRIVVAPLTSITDSQGRPLDYHDLKPGRWVSVEAEPDERSRLVAERIILIRGR